MQNPLQLLSAVGISGITTTDATPPDDSDHPRLETVVQGAVGHFIIFTCDQPDANPHRNFSWCCSDEADDLGKGPREAQPAAPDPATFQVHTLQGYDVGMQLV